MNRTSNIVAEILSALLWCGACFGVGYVAGKITNETLMTRKALARLHETQHIAADIRLRHMTRELEYHEVYMQFLADHIARYRR